ncbi:cell division protein FtsQ/DivIB [Povalibacter sp.]|uniref:cell division protein FtsQ/DivIB n=1 Tax=Povalibacter sp. TaxID=1962978 RepID=UPI002F42BB10
MKLASRKRNRRKAEGNATPGWLAHLSLERLQPLFSETIRPVLGMSGVILGALLAIWGLTTALDRPIAKIEVAAQFQRVAPIQIDEAVASFRGAGFLSVDLDALQASLETIPWVDRARVERRWPRAVRVVITEHVAAARWGEDGLMNTRGELFLKHSRHIPPELPQLIGPEGTEEAVARLYLDSYPRLLAVGMRLAKVELDPRGAWELTLSNAVHVRLGRQDVPERLERFLRVASPLVAARSNEVGYVDLRYSNGFSVGWNPPATRVARDAAGSMPDA